MLMLSVNVAGQMRKRIMKYDESTLLTLSLEGRGNAQGKTDSSGFLSFSPSAGDYTIDVSGVKNPSGKSIRLVMFDDRKYSGANRVLTFSFKADTLIDVAIKAEQASRIRYVAMFVTDNHRTLTAKAEIRRGKVGMYEIDSSELKKDSFLVGAVFFDGWSYRSQQSNQELSNLIYHTTDLYRNSGRYNTAEARRNAASKLNVYNGSLDGSGKPIDDWRDYVIATEGAYPPHGVSFSNYFPEEVKKGQRRLRLRGEKETYDVSVPDEFVTGKPLDSLDGVPLGWRNTDTQEQMEAQIQLALKYGIDYFMFNLKFAAPMIGKDGKVDDRLFEEAVYGNGHFNGNRAIVNFLRSPSHKKMKFCLMVNVSPSDNKHYAVMVDYIKQRFFSDSCYLKVDGKPVIAFFHSLDKDKLNFWGSDALLCGNHRSIDGVFSYNGSYRFRKDFDKEKFTSMPFADIAENSIKEGSMFSMRKYAFIPVALGFDETARANFISGKRWRYEKPRDRQEGISFMEYLESQYYNFRDYKGKKMFLIYAWNEFCEGANLLPTQDEIDRGVGFYRLEKVKEFTDKYRLR